ncbi:MAG: YceI family protein [Bacteroidales bacterium]
MKTLKNTIFLLASSLVFVACGSRDLGEKAQVTDAKEVASVSGEEVTYAVNTENSIIEWIGSKPTGTHQGSLNIKSGELYVQGENIVGGKFILDMRSIKNFDLEDSKMNDKLVNHLHSDDFFSTETYPEGIFEVTEAVPFDGMVAEGEITPTHTIAGNLTIKDITRNVRFNTFVQFDDTGITAETVPFVINRAEYDVRFKSKSFFQNLQDDFIHDDIGLKIKLEATPRG